MKRRSVRLSLLLSTVFTAPAFAQSIPVPPTRELIDDNGIDLFRGTFTAEQTVASLGGSQGMSYRTIIRGGSASNNIDAFIQSSANVFYVTYGGRTDRFLKSGSTYSPTEANGASLTFSSNIYTYTSREGTIVTFNKAMLETYNQYGNEGLPTSIVEPSGQRLDFNYLRSAFCQYYDGDFCAGGIAYVRRLETVKSAYGYALKYFYETDTMDDGSQVGSFTTVVDRRLINLAVDYCGAVNCTITQNWPGPTAPNHIVNTYISSGNQITGVRRPGSTTNDLTISYTSGRVSAVADHAGTTTYSYADLSGYRTVTVTDSLNKASVYTFLISSERLTSFKDPSLNSTNYSYDNNGRLTRITMPEGNYVNYTYDGRGNLTEVRRVDKTGVSNSSDLVRTAS